MANILEDATTIVAEREQRYDLVSADLYFMAQLYNDWETQDQIWQEAWNQGNNRLIMLLLLAEMHLLNDA